MSAALSDALSKRRQDFEDAMQSLGLDAHAQLALKASCEAVAKARAVWAVAQFIETRASAAESQ